MVNTYLIGQTAEEIAANFLKEKKLKIISRNYRTRYGEIDIIAKDKGQFIFVEVKAKNTQEYGQPYEMVTVKKAKKLIQTAKSYLMENKENIEKNDWRIDIVSINYETAKIDWIKNAVTE